MTVTRIPATRDDAAEVTAAFAAVPFGVPDTAPAPALPPLPTDAPGRWADASGRSPAEAGVVVYVHGGGFEHAEPAMELRMARHLSALTGRPAVAVGYRLAPAHPYPAALDDLTAVHRALLGLGVPASRILLFGESAGGTLILSALLTLRRDGFAPPAGAAVMAPLTDLTLSSPSITAGTGGPGPAGLARIRDGYLGGAPSGEAPQSPLHGDLAGLPPILLAVGEADALLDDSRRFAAAARAAGTPADLDVYAEMPHVFHLTGLAPRPPAIAVRFWHRFAAWANDRGDGQHAGPGDR